MNYNGWYFSLNDFVSRNQINKIIAENMINVSVLQEGDDCFEEKAYFCFYNAYKICYDLTFNGTPSKWKIPDYLKQSHYRSNNKDLVTIMQSVTMSIVVILLEHCNFPSNAPIVEVIEAIKNAIKGMFIHEEDDGFVSAEIIQSIRPTECIKVSRTLHRGTNIDYKIDINEFSFVSNKSIDDFFQNKIDEAVKKAVDEIPVLNAEFRGNTLYLNQVPKKVIDAQKSTLQKSVPDDNLQEQLADTQKIIEKQTKTIQELKEEIVRLKEAKDSAKSDDQNDIEINRLKVVYEDTLVTLLKPAFYDIEDDVRDFLRRIQGLDNQGVTDVARQFLKGSKITPSKRGRFIWKILIAAKLYTCSEQNWTAALRKVN